MNFVNLCRLSLMEIPWSNMLVIFFWTFTTFGKLLIFFVIFSGILHTNWSFRCVWERKQDLIWSNSTMVFYIFCQVISFTILRYRKLKATYLGGKGKHDGSNSLDSSHFHMLIEAWEPVSMGYKRRYWNNLVP